MVRRHLHRGCSSASPENRQGAPRSLLYLSVGTLYEPSRSASSSFPPSIAGTSPLRYRPIAMRRFNFAAAVLLHSVAAICQGPPAFNITAISARNQASRLECWQLDAEPDFSRAATNFDLGTPGESFVGILPPRTSSDGTLTNAQAVQYVPLRQGQARQLRRMEKLEQLTAQRRYSLVMAGQVHIVTPSSGLPDELNEVYIEGGRYGWLIAADTADVAAEGHVTDFPSDQRTIIAQFPLRDNQAPAHSVLHDGPCTKEDYAGL